MRWMWGLLRLRRAAASPLPPFMLKGIWQEAQIAVGGGQMYCTQSAESSRPIGRYPIPYKKDLPYDIVELMEEVETKGQIYTETLSSDKGRLSKADRELIVVATSTTNRCPYCVIAHSALHRIYSKQPTLADQVTVNWELAELGPRELAILSFALAVTHAENITDEHFKKLEVHGFDREDAWDMAMVSAFFAMSNRIAHFTDLRPNKEFYTMGRLPKEKAEKS
ncbi:uncharacterized protein LOC115092180 isoform X3 [Rhinatrema bivittatum]|uniref:uncharacterized protein LOC115092180 isoform X3 n=1 Tax=Rhinatrema bivittatum TaxID=194408 RepID=UPI00112AC663|nr:uncharacterized protein LOC115092180 isoform X3 [Rhinatrema bivittatum]